MTGGDVPCPDLHHLQGTVSTAWVPRALQSALVPRADARPRSGLRLATASPHPSPEHLWPPAPSPSAPGSTLAPRLGGPRNTHGPDGQGNGGVGEVFPRETGGPLGLGESTASVVLSPSGAWSWAGGSSRGLWALPSSCAALGFPLGSPLGVT